MLRPEPMSWIDIVVDRRSTTVVFEFIAAAGVFEPDVRDAAGFDAWARVLPETSTARELRARLRRFESYLPAPDRRETTAGEHAKPFAEIAGDLEELVDRWQAAAGEILRRLSEIDAEMARLVALDAVVRLLPAELELALWQSQSAGERAYVPVVVHGAPADVEVFLDAADARAWRPVPDSGEALAARGVIAAKESATIMRLARAAGLNVIDIPSWLSGVPEIALERIEARRASLAKERNTLLEELHCAARANRMGAVRWLVERQNWLEEILGNARSGENFVHLGGWVPRQRYPALLTRLRESGYPFLVRLDDEHDHDSSPSMLNNPAWAKRFELFVSGFGTPGVDEVDPSAVLAFVTPLMFGYMFGDVGQGLVLVVAGWLLAGRAPFLRLLVPAGISSMLFGVLYGSVFSIEHVFPALWLHPLDHPLTVLGLPLLFGAILMLLSLAFGYLRARWRGRTSAWLVDEFPVVLCYLAVPAWFVYRPAAVAMLSFALALLLAGGAPRASSLARWLTRLPVAVLSLLEHWLQLVINTLSFTRLGAFALAHAGLGSALVSLSALPASTAGAVAVLVAGNLFIIALEGLVVSIQTTRLVMFEFFRRFLEGSGRRFRPLTLDAHPGGAGPAGVPPFPTT